MIKLLFKGAFAVFVFSTLLLAPKFVLAQSTETELLDVAHAAEIKGDYPLALSAYQKIQNSIPASVEAARIQFLLGDKEAANTQLQSVWTQYRSQPATWSSLDLLAIGKAAQMLGEQDKDFFRRAVSVFEQAIRSAPESAGARIALGDLLLDKYNSAEAVGLYQEVLEQDETNTDALLGVARSRHFDHSSESQAIVDQILKDHPDHVGANTFKARLLIELEDYDTAMVHTESALRLQTANPEALTIKAAIYYLRGEQADFDLLMAQIREKTPGYIDIYLTLAKIAAQNRRYSEAIQFALGATSIDPQSWQGHGLIGLNRLRVGQMSLGRNSLEISFKGDPFNIWIRNTLELLDRMDSFVSVRSKRFVLVADAREAPVLAPMLLPLAERAFDRFEERYGITPPTPIRIEVFSKHEDFSVRTVGLVGVDLLGVCFGQVIALDSPSTLAFDPTHLGSTLWHEIAHSFHLWMTDHKMPRWFSEGLAVHEEHLAKPGWGADPSPAFLQSLSAGKLNPPSRLNESFLRPESQAEIAHAYYQGSLVLKKVESEYGVEAIRGFLRAYGIGLTTAELIPAVTGVSVENFDTDFNDWINKQFDSALEAVSDGSFAQQIELGQSLITTGNLKQAESILKAAKITFPDYAVAPSPYHLLADLYIEQGNTEAAIVELEALLRINADDLGSYRKLAELYTQTDRKSAAARVQEQALFVAPFDLEIRSALAQQYEKTGDWLELVNQRKAMLALDPPDPLEARFQLASAMNQAEMVEDARSEVLTALEKAPLYDDALELLLQIHERRSAKSIPANPTQEVTK